MRLGVRLGIDVGRVRVGVARSDPDGVLAVPVVTLSAADAIASIEALVEEFSVLEVIVGEPVSLSGATTDSTQLARSFAAELATALECPVRLVDERLSTTQAEGQMRGVGRSQRSQRPVIDQAAAVILVQHALDAERIQGVPPGRLVAPAMPDDD